MSKWVILREPRDLRKQRGKGRRGGQGCDHEEPAKEFALYPEDSRKPLKEFKQGSDGLIPRIVLVGCVGERGIS